MRDNNGNFVRFALALSILVYHCHQRLGLWPGMNFPYVACFLTLSGYLILGSRDHSRNAWHFLWKRFLRIWPAFLVAFALFAIFQPSMFGFMIRHTFYIGGPGGKSYWTITTEELLYGLLVISYALGAYKTVAGPIAGLFASLAIRWAFPCIGPWDYVQNIVPMFFVGNILYMLQPKWSWKIAAPLLIAYVVMVFNPLGGTWNELFQEMLLAYPLILFSFHTKGFFKWFDRMGDSSYSLFLYHGALIDGMVLALGNPNPWVLTLAVAAPSLSLAYLSWWFMERPILMFKDVTVHRKRAILPILLQSISQSSCTSE